MLIKKLKKLEGVLKERKEQTIFYAAIVSSKQLGMLLFLMSTYKKANSRDHKDDNLRTLNKTG